MGAWLGSRYLQYLPTSQGNFPKHIWQNIANKWMNNVVECMYRAPLIGGPQVPWMLQASWVRSSKQQQEQNSPNLGPTYWRSPVDRMSHRKLRETKKQPSRALRPSNQLLLSFPLFSVRHPVYVHWSECCFSYTTIAAVVQKTPHLPGRQVTLHKYLKSIDVTRENIWHRIVDVLVKIM